MATIPAFNNLISSLRPTDVLVGGPQNTEEEDQKKQESETDLALSTAPSSYIPGQVAAQSTGRQLPEDTAAQRLIQQNAGEQQKNIKQSALEGIKGEQAKLEIAASDYATKVQENKPTTDIDNLVQGLYSTPQRGQSVTKLQELLGQEAPTPEQFTYAPSEKVSAQVRALTTPEGRAQALKEIAGPQYTQGQLALDTALMRAAGGSYADVMAQQKALSDQAAAAKEEADRVAGEQQDTYTQAVQNIRDRLGGNLSDLQATIGQGVDAAKAQYGERATKETMAMREKAIGELNAQKAAYQNIIDANSGKFGVSAQSYIDAVKDIDAQIEAVRRGSRDVGTVSTPDVTPGAVASQDQVGAYNALMQLLGKGGQIMVPTEAGAVGTTYTGVNDYLSGISPELISTITNQQATPGTPAESAGKIAAKLDPTTPGTVPSQILTNLDPTNKSGVVGNVVDKAGQVAGGLAKVPGQAFETLVDAISGKDVLNPTTTVKMNIKYEPDGRGYTIDPVLGRKIYNDYFNVTWNGQGQAVDHAGNRKPEFDRAAITGGALANTGLTPGGIAPDVLPVNKVLNSGSTLTTGNSAMTTKPVTTPTPIPASQKEFEDQFNAGLITTNSLADKKTARRVDSLARTASMQEGAIGRQWISAQWPNLDPVIKSRIITTMANTWGIPPASLSGWNFSTNTPIYR